MGKSDRQEQTSTVNTTTTTSINDIGLTGANAVDLVEVLQNGALDSEAIRATSFDNLVQSVGSNYNQLIGGANNLITNATAANETNAGVITEFNETVRQLSSSAEKQTASAANTIQNAATEAQNTIRTLSARATGQDTDFVKALPFIAVIAVGLISFVGKGK